MKKEREEKAAASAAASVTLQARSTPIMLPPMNYTGTIAKKPRPHSYSVPGPSTRPVPYTARPQHQQGQQPAVAHKDAAMLREEMSHLHALITKVKSQMIPTPALPAPKTPIWPRNNQGPDLPDGV